MVDDSINHCHKHNDFIELRMSHPKHSEMYFKENFAKKPVRLFQPIPHIARINWQHLSESKQFRNCYFRVLYYSQKIDKWSRSIDQDPVDYYEIKSSKLLLNDEKETDVSIFPNQEYFFKLVSIKYGNLTKYDYKKKLIPSQNLNKYLESNDLWWLNQQYGSVSRWTSFQPCCLSSCNPLFKKKPLVTTVKVLEGDGYVPIVKSEVSWKLDYLQYPSCISHYESGEYIGYIDNRKYWRSTYYLLKRLNRFETKFSIDNENVTCLRSSKYVILVHGWNNRTFHTEHWTPNKCDSKKRTNSTVDGTNLDTWKPFRWTTPFSDLPKLWNSLLCVITKRLNI